MAATTISRATWTDDSGTPASPVGDGTVINNARLQADVYDKIDALFASGTFTLGGLVAVEGFGQHGFSAGGTGEQKILLRNSTAGTGNYAGLNVRADSTTVTAVQHFSTTFASSGPAIADGGLLTSTGAGGLSVSATHASGILRFYAGLAEQMRVGTDGTLFLNDTTDGDVAAHGICINHGAASDILSLSFKASAITRAAGPLADADTFGGFGQQNASGGLAMYGMTEAAATTQPAIQLYAHGDTGTGDTAKTTAARGFAEILASENNTAIGADENILAVRNYSTTRFILDGDGDSHQDVGTAWTNFDDYDDVALLHALSAGVSRRDDPLREAFGSFLEAHRDTLSRSRIVTFNDDGHHFINWSRAHMLTIGAVRQLGIRLQHLEQRLLHG